MDVGGKQNFVGIDVSVPSNHALIQQTLLDGFLPLSQARGQVFPQRRQGQRATPPSFSLPLYGSASPCHSNQKHPNRRVSEKRSSLLSDRWKTRWGYKGSSSDLSY